MTEVRTALKQRGLSPKVVADLLVSIIAFAALLLFGFDVEADPVLAAAISKLAGSVAGFLAGPGEVEVEKSHPEQELEF